MYSRQAHSTLGAVGIYAHLDHDRELPQADLCGSDPTADVVSYSG